MDEADCNLVETINELDSPGGCTVHTADICAVLHTRYTHRYRSLLSQVRERYAEEEREEAVRNQVLTVKEMAKESPSNLPIFFSGTPQ